HPRPAPFIEGVAQRPKFAGNSRVASESLALPYQPRVFETDLEPAMRPRCGPHGDIEKPGDTRLLENSNPSEWRFRGQQWLLESSLVLDALCSSSNST